MTCMIVILSMLTAARGPPGVYSRPGPAVELAANGAYLPFGVRIGWSRRLRPTTRARSVRTVCSGSSGTAACFSACRRTGRLPRCRRSRPSWPPIPGSGTRWRPPGRLVPRSWRRWSTRTWTARRRGWPRCTSRAPRWPRRSASTGRRRIRPCSGWRPGWPRASATCMPRACCTATSSRRTWYWPRTGRGSLATGSGMPPNCRAKTPVSCRRSRSWPRTSGRPATSSAWERCWPSPVADTGHSVPGRLRR